MTPEAKVLDPFERAFRKMLGVPVPESQTPVKVTKKPTEEEVKKEQNVNEK